MAYLLGVDVGSTKSHSLIADESGRVVGFGASGPGNPQGVGYDGLRATLRQGLDAALAGSGLRAADIAGAGFGIAGYDWPSQEEAMLEVLGQLGLDCPLALVNDGVPPLLAGAAAGWGVSLIAGTGCNCRGWDRERKREGRVTGYGYDLGEFAGASELVWRAMQLVTYEWTQRGAPTALTDAFIKYAGARDLPDLVEGYTRDVYRVDAGAAPLIFAVARAGDVVAAELIRWAGGELGEMATAVIRQLDLADERFDVVLSGSLFKGDGGLIAALRERVAEVAPGARLVRLAAPPVVGAVVLAMEQVGLGVTAVTRQTLADSLAAWHR